MKREVTIQEALTELAAAKIELESMQQQLVLKDQLLSSKDEKITIQLFTINQQQKQLKQKDDEIKTLKDDNNLKDLKILGLEERLKTQLSYRFGSHSEKSFEQWLPLFDELDDFPENELLTKEELEEIREENIVVKAYKRRKCGRKKLDDTLERVPIYHDIPESEKICGCGAKLIKVGEKVTERLNIIPEKIYVEKHIYPVYACRVCEGSGDEDHPVFRQVPAAKNIIPKSIATPGLLSYIFVNKYCNHMPYYRQAQHFERHGADLSRATMDKWQLEVYEKIKPLENVLLNHIKSGKVINMDETTCRILNYENGNKERKKSYIWLAHGGPKDKKLVVYRYFESRSPKYIKPFINGFKGWLQTDEYPGYEAALKEHNILFPNHKIIHVSCAAHIRRKFYDALLNGKSKGAAKALKYIQQMYYEENRLREQNLSDSELVAKRKEIIKPIMDEFYNWMIETQPTVPGSFKFGQAINYAISAWPHLMNYIDCPEIYLDNSISERSIRPYVLSRKNFLFSASEDGARSTCLLFSLIECAKINNINPEEYLSSIFELAADTTGWTDSNWSELLPWNIKLIKKSDVSTVLVA